MAEWDKRHTNDPYSHAPAPPERSSSYEHSYGYDAEPIRRVAFQDSQISHQDTGVSWQQYNSRTSHGDSFEANQFHGIPYHDDMHTNNNDKYPDEVIADMATPQRDVQQLNLITGVTPGVVGAQEVYRDPRDRRLAQQKQELKFDQGEKLTFKEKMKLFASETGENRTPQDKTKISSRQKEIEEYLKS